MLDVPVVWWVLALMVLLVLVLDFFSGVQSATHAISTVVSTGVMKPAQAVAFAAFFGLLAAFLFQLQVVATVAQGIIDPAFVDPHVIFGALAGSLVWNGLTWRWGVPSSSSHALIGGILGAALAKAGTAPLVWAGVWKTLGFIFIAPLLAYLVGSLLMVAVAWLCRRSSPHRVDSIFRRLQFVSAAVYGLGRGGNDAQKSIGLIWLLLLATGYSKTGAAGPPSWVVVCCYGVLGLGTVLGGWRIVKTMGQRITKLKPVGGFCAESGSGITLVLCNAWGVPVSTTHTINGAILGVGSVRHASAVRWGLARHIVTTWLVTLPATALMAALCYGLGRLLF